MKTIKIEIVGTAPLLVHRFSEESESQKPDRPTMHKVRDPREEATKAAYIAPDGTYYFNAFAVTRAMGAAGVNFKMKGSRKSLRFVVPSAVRLTTDAITILDDKGPSKRFEVDARPVTIPSTRGRVMRYRPRWNTWRAKFEILLDDDVMSIEMAQRLLTDAGASIGFGDFRPSSGGPFGTFRVVSFKEAA